MEVVKKTRIWTHSTYLEFAFTTEFVHNEHEYTFVKSNFKIFK